MHPEMAPNSCLLPTRLGVIVGRHVLRHGGLLLEAAREKQGR
jgi:hypothetical protein